MQAQRTTMPIRLSEAPTAHVWPEAERSLGYLVPVQVGNGANEFVQIPLAHEGIEPGVAIPIPNPSDISITFLTRQEVRRWCAYAASRVGSASYWIDYDTPPGTDSLRTFRRILHKQGVQEPLLSTLMTTVTFSLAHVECQYGIQCGVNLRILVDQPDQPRAILKPEDLDPIITLTHEGELYRHLVIFEGPHIVACSKFRRGKPDKTSMLSRLSGNTGDYDAREEVELLPWKTLGWDSYAWQRHKVLIPHARTTPQMQIDAVMRHIVSPSDRHQNFDNERRKLQSLVSRVVGMYARRGTRRDLILLRVLSEEGSFISATVGMMRGRWRDPNLQDGYSYIYGFGPNGKTLECQFV